jgi:Alginate lyase
MLTPNKVLLELTIEHISTLALAAYFLNDEDYAKRARDKTIAWFLDPNTGMLPTLRGAGVVFTGSTVEGTTGRPEGINDLATLPDLLNGLGLLAMVRTPLATRLLCHAAVIASSCVVTSMRSGCAKAQGKSAHEHARARTHQPRAAAARSPRLCDHLLRSSRALALFVKLSQCSATAGVPERLDRGRHGEHAAMDCAVRHLPRDRARRAVRPHDGELRWHERRRAATRVLHVPRQARSLPSPIVSLACLRMSCPVESWLVCCLNV